MAEGINFDISKLKEEEKTKKSYSVYLDSNNVDKMRAHFGLPLSKLIDKLFGAIVQAIESKEKEEVKKEDEVKNTESK